MIPRTRQRAFVLPALAVAALSFTGGCRRVSVLKQRCLSGEADACESACTKGVYGEGGCFQAGNAHWQRGALDFGGDEFKRARSFFKKSCDGGYGDGCLFAAQTVDAPYGPLDPTAISDASVPKTISDGELAERERLLTRACDLSGGPACKRLGDVTIGKSSTSASLAYERSCRSSREPEACKAQRSREVNTLEQWRSACTRGVADDCTRLGDALYVIDAPRAVRLFVNECGLRGVESIAGGLGRFVADRAKSAQAGAVSSPTPLAPPSADAPSVTSLVPEVRGSVAVVAVERAVQVRSGVLSGCAASLHKTDRATLTAELVVDRTGDVWRARALAGTLGPRETACMLSVLEDLEFGGPLPVPATVTLPLAIGGVPAGRR